MEAVQFTIGAEVTAADGVCGSVTQVVVDPITSEVTHLVVEPPHRAGLGRLVPVDRLDATPGRLVLRGTRAEFEDLDPAEETQFLPGSEGLAGYGANEVLAWPYYGGNVSAPVTFDTLPVGEVAVRRGEPVHATDGPIGQVKGLVVDGATHHVTHVLLQEGHAWGRKEVAIPIAAVVAIDDGIQLGMTKREVEGLPAVEVGPVRH